MLGNAYMAAESCVKNNAATDCVICENKEKNDFLLASKLASIWQEHADVQSFCERGYDTFNLISNSFQSAREKLNLIKTEVGKVQEKMENLKYPDNDKVVLQLKQLHFLTSQFATIEEERVNIQNFCEKENDILNSIFNSSLRDEEKLNFVEMLKARVYEKMGNLRYPNETAPLLDRFYCSIDEMLRNAGRLGGRNGF
jgi:hypothetical protein